MLTESQPQPKSIRIVGRARIFFFALPILVTLIILGIGQTISRSIADDNAMGMSRQYAIEATANFQIFMNPHMRVMQQMAYSTAIARWLSGEDDAAQRASAFEAMQGHATVLPQAFFSFMFFESGDRYTFTTGLTFDNFVLGSNLAYDEDDSWFYNTIEADAPFVLNIQHLRTDAYGNSILYLWSNHRIYYQGQIVGIVSIGSPFADIQNAAFHGFGMVGKRGYIINENGAVLMDSDGILETAVGGFLTYLRVPEATDNPNLAEDIEYHLQGLQNGLFPLGTPSREAVRLAVGNYRYAGISPIVGTGWSVLVLSGTEAAFDMRYMPLMVTAAILIVLLLLIGGLLIQRTVFQPLQLAEEKEREAFEQAQLMLDYAPIGMTLFDKELNTVTCNREAWTMFGVSPDTVGYLDYQKMSSTMPTTQPDGKNSMEMFNEYISVALDTGLCNAEIICQKLDGTLMPTDMTWARVNYKGDTVIMEYAVDLTQLKKLEAQLREEEMREAHRWNQALINSAPYIISVWEESNMAMVSDAAIERFGIADAQIFADRFNEFSPEFQPCGTASSEKALSYIQQAHEEGFVRFEWMHQNLAGEPLPCEIIGKSIKFNGKDVALLYNRDLREIKAAEENERKLKEELLYRERLLTAGNHIARALLTADSTAALMNGMGVVGELIQLDRVGIWHYEKIDEEFYFVKQHEWLSEIGKQKKRYAEGFAFPYNGSPEFFDILLDGRAINGPTSEQTPAIQAHFNEYGVVSIAILPMFLDGTLSGFLSLQDCVNVRTYTKNEMDIMASVGLMFTSVFNRFELQEEQRRIEVAEESNRAKSAFLARMSHEIRTPITAVMGISEIELQNPDILPQTENSFTKIHNSANSLLGIVNDILDLSKIEVGKTEFAHDEYDVASLIVDTASIHIGFASSKNIKYHVNVDENLPTRLIGDALRIGQIINNILSNAFKYTIEGSVELSFDCVKDNDRDDCIRLQIAVKDTGLGMTPEQLADLDNEYTRYHERNYSFIEGTGLGMPIVYNIVRLMGAEIKISSEVSVGTTVVVCIPQQIVGADVLGKEAARNLEQFKEAATIKRFTFTPEPMPYGSVLVVDDVEANLYVAKGLLTFYDLKIETCNNGFDVIEKIKQGKVYDIVFMDYMMPGLNGTETMRQMRDMGYAHPIVALTANAMIGMAEEFVKEGFDGFVSKPIQTKQLDAVLTKYIKDRQSPEVIETAKSVSSPKGDITGYQNDPALLAKLMADFSRSHKNTYASLCHAIETGDINTAHRIAHTVKGSAGLIGKGTLMRVASDIEALLARNETPTNIQLSAFEQALNAVLDDIGETETTPLYEGDNLEREDALALLNEVGSLLTSHNVECMGFVGELRKIPNATELCREIEDFNFSAAAEILENLKAELEAQ